MSIIINKRRSQIIDIGGMNMEESLSKNNEEKVREKSRLDILKVLKNKIIFDTDKEKDDVTSLRNAYKEWKIAQIYFENVTDPDLVDHAIYSMEAARLKYIYFLKKLKRENSKAKYILMEQ